MKRSSWKADLMKQNTRHQRQDNAVEVNTENAVDTFMDNAEDAVEVNTENAVEDSMENAEVGNEVQGGGNFIVRDGIFFKARERPTGGLHNILRFDFEDINVQAVNTINIYEKVVSQPATKNIDVVNNKEAQYKAVLSAWGDAACLSQRAEEDAACLNLRVMGEQSEMLTACLTKKAMEEQLYREEEDSNVCGGREEVLAEQLMMLEGLSSYREQKYEVAEQTGMVENIVENEAKDKKNELEKSWKM